MPSVLVLPLSIVRRFSLGIALSAASLLLCSVAAQTGATTSPAAAIIAVLQQQAAAWNRGDLDGFASGYKNSPDILFIGRSVEHGYAGMLAGYKAHYPTREAMGTLTFSQLEVQPLDPRFATVTGHFHLQRTQKGGGEADGYFLLVVEHTAMGWKVVRDDTTASPHSSSADASTRQRESRTPERSHIMEGMRLRGMLRILRSLTSLLVLSSGVAATATAQGGDQMYTASRQQLDVTKVVIAQEDAWNHGDLEGYLAHLKDSKDTEAMLNGPVRGTAAIRAAFHASFPSRDSMGQLDQSEVEVRELGPGFALATGRYRLTRSRHNGGDAQGTFVEIFEKTDAGWQVIFTETT